MNKRLAAIGWTHLTFVESDSTPGQAYAIERRADGALRCACAAFRFMRGELGSAAKTCKHLDAYRIGAAIARNVTDGVPSRVVSQTLGGERFTFRRAISLDGSLSGM